MKLFNVILNARLPKRSGGQEVKNPFSLLTGEMFRFAQHDNNKKLEFLGR